MRRRLELFIPIVLLAITVQLFAPIAAFRAFAYAADDPLYMATICAGTAAASDDTQTAPAETHHHNGDCCAFCGAGLGGSAALQPPPYPVFVSLQRRYQRISWLETATPMPTIRVGSNTQARAPPQAA